MTESLAIDPNSIAWSVPETDRGKHLADRPLLILMHGRGSNEQDLFSLVPLLLDRFVIASIRAPRVVVPGSYSWFPADSAGLPSPGSGDSAVAAVLDWIDTLVLAGPIVLLGFSQGGAMAVHAVRHAPARFAAAVNLSGFVIPAIRAEDVILESLRPPVFWGRDVEDPIISADAIAITSAWLPAHSRLTARLYPALGHSISQGEIVDVNEFLRGVLGDANSGTDGSAGPA